MATWDDVRRIIATLPDTEEHPSYGGRPSWRVRHTAFVWERPLDAADRAALGALAPDEDEAILGVRVDDEGVKAALIADEPHTYLTTPHFDGYAVVLVRLQRISTVDLAELIEDAWRTRAPRALVAQLDASTVKQGLQPPANTSATNRRKAPAP